MIRPPDRIPSQQISSQQKGVALLTILIMVVLATILAASILKHQQANLDETRMLLRQDQALLYAQSAEYFFSELLVQDAKDNKTDNLNENWAKPFPVFPVEDGFVSGDLTDENSKFNLNALLSKDGTVNPTARAFFQAMLQRLSLDANLVEAVIDWQDADDETIGAMGAENSYYQGVQQDYLAPNQMFSSIEQLQLVRGFAGEPYQKLKPYITALPQHETKININTASAFVLSCLNEQLNPLAVASTLQQMRENMQPFENFSSIWQVAPFSAVEEGQRNQFADLFDVKSSFFTANITVNLSERQRSLRSWLYRHDSTVQSYQRSWLVLPRQQ
ncbi:type II secretion system minor pseudopilin GspK [Acinetobacter puyangensis]|uniref:Type II secretion system protein K n=1 Tax=Acinetobacter puyangensis TaxID=1096779 RepID=A0A240EAE0_9GAMM|nr:type II secretion system minor pseudopilin GspK [Acinetobacter puyangensis]SNX45516.1 type II secretion system protein K (GspK) [Acinetobacter puyangensis]